jgi:HlyD family secretion protein
MRIRYLTAAFLLVFALSSCHSGDETSDAYGNFEATEIIISAQANGEILNLGIEEGDVLKANQIVGLIDTTDLFLRKKLLGQQIKTIRSSLVSISSEIDVQKQQLENNTISQKRITKLYDQGAATKKQLDDINGLVDVNKKMIISIKSKKQSILDQIEGVKIQIEQIEEAISKSVIKIPSPGTVIVKYAEQGELASMGKPLFKIADINKIKLKVYISGDQLPNIKLGDIVEVLYDKNTKSNNLTKGRVIWISGTAEFTPKTIQTKEERVNLVYAVKILVDNDGSIKIGMPGEMNFIK